MITIHDWTREATLGGEAVVRFDLGAPARPVVELRLDAIGDALPGVMVHGEDLRAVRALGLPMRRTGTFSLHITAIDDLGCRDETAQARNVVVSR